MLKQKGVGKSTPASKRKDKAAAANTLGFPDGFASMLMAHFSLIMVGLMWVIPFILSIHEYPLTTFDQEWWSVVLGLFAMVVLVSGQYWQDFQVPRIVLLPLALIAVLLAQLAMGKLPFAQQGLLYGLYFLFAAMLMLLGAALRRNLGMERVVGTLAIALLIGTAISTALGVLQHFGWHTWLDEWVVRKVSSSLYGNVAQPNHYANYLALGLVSLGWLYQQQKLRLAQVVVLVIPILFVMTLSGSRSAWFYMIAMVGWAALAWFKNRSLRPLLLYTIALTVGFIAMQFIVQLPFLASAEAETNTLQRFAFATNSDTSGSIRLYLWHEATKIFMQSPWLGVGFGQFAIHHFQLLPELRADNIVGLYNNAHNFVFQMAAEAGVPGILAVLIPAGLWLFGMRRATLNATQWWGFAAASVLTIHSLLEYPLWYTYFIAIFAFIVGMLDETSFRLPLRNLGRASMVVILLLSWLAMIQVQFDYRGLKAVLAPQSVSNDQAENTKHAKEGLAALHNSPLLAPYAEFFASSFLEVNPVDIKKKIAFNALLLHYIPTGEVAYRQALLLAQDGQYDEAKQVFEQAIWSYPGNGAAHGLLMALQQRDAEHFSALLEFANQKEQEHANAIRKQ